MTKQDIHADANDWLAKALRLEYEGTKLEKNHHTLDTGGRDVNTGSEIRLEWFRLNPYGKSQLIE